LCVLWVLFLDVFNIMLCNVLWCTIDSKLVNIFPKCIAMSKSHVVVCSDSEVYTW
jgi:hypothetical protein